MTPPGVEALVFKGHEVVMETNAGRESGISDDAYKDVGVDIVSESHKVYERGEINTD